MSDFSPYECPVGTTVLGEYQRQARKRPLWWLLPLAVAVFTVFLVRDYLEAPDEEDLTWSVMRTADIELSVAQGAKGWPNWVNWMVGLESEEEALKWMAQEVSLMRAKGSLTLEGEKAAQWIIGLAEGRVEELSEQEWRQKFSEGLYSWERIAARDRFESSAPEWWREEMIYYEAFDRRRALVAAVGGGIWWAVFLVGLPFLPAALRCFLPRHHQPLPPATRAWLPSRVTVLFLIVDVLVGWLLAGVYFLIPAAAWDFAYMPTIIFTDTLWRVGGPLMLAAMLLIRWRHAPRLLGLIKKPEMGVVMGMLSLGFLYDLGVYELVSEFTRREDLEGLSYLEEGGWGLAFGVLSAVILAPVVEEIVFRGFLFQSYLRRFGFLLAMVLSTVLFVVIHYYGVYGSLSVAFFGLGACALYRATGSLWTAIIFHAVTNGLITLSMWPLYYGF
ncbi:MAG: CPBP family intramembrane glutamic endopeptidase [Roseibacillus sp.]